MSARPLDVLEETLDETVTVRLKGGETYRGILAGYDQHMNVVIEPIPEAQQPSDEPDGPDSVEDTTIIRGDNVVSITP
ncbi:MAG TPA: LSM domain-containing protein [Natrialbaceae archaeon]|nr:LSM domain-containing protein [Natrialbaceae archaeon]